MELYIVRHGKTFWNEAGRLQGRSDVDLLTQGRCDAVHLGEELDQAGIAFDAIYVSPLIRAYETACLIRGRKTTPLIRDTRLAEISFGIMEGCLHSTWEEAEHFFHAPELYQEPKGAESITDACVRGRDFICDVIEPAYGKKNRIMIVAHGAINKAMMCYLEGNDLAHFWGDRLQKNCEATVFDYDGKKWIRRF